ncbi:recombinase family protein [Bradyrhizobium sp. RT4b]|uniref:recombinase family protein n=1 Tax=Bradyrhizobium sp. RT4b TaxID=3156379 RepID=UPI003395526D
MDPPTSLRSSDAYSISSSTAGNRTRFIRRQLNEVGIAKHNGRPWTDGMIPIIFSKENYIGKTIRSYFASIGGEGSQEPGSRVGPRRSCDQPIVDSGIFVRTRERLAE